MSTRAGLFHFEDRICILSRVALTGTGTGPDIMVFILVIIMAILDTKVAIWARRNLLCADTVVSEIKPGVEGKSKEFGEPGPGDHG